MKDRCRKFTPLARQRFGEGLQKLHADVSSVQGSPMGLRPNMCSFLLAVTAGEAIYTSRNCTNADGSFCEVSCITS